MAHRKRLTRSDYRINFAQKWFHNHRKKHPTYTIIGVKQQGDNRSTGKP